MAERRFTRLKASLSETAAKARENVSRELRQSLVSDGDNCEAVVDDDYEVYARELELQTQMAFPDDDIDVKDVKPIVDSECPPIEEVGGGFARECLRHLSFPRKTIGFKSEKYFGSLFECFETKRELKPQIFWFDDSDDDSRVVRETNCLMNRMTGWLSLTSSHDTCTLSFFRDRKRSQMVWTQEVTQEVEKSGNNSFRIDCHSIELNGEEEVESWVRDINQTRFDVRRHVTLLNNDLNQSLEKFFQKNSLNLFSTFGLNSRAFCSLRAKRAQNQGKDILHFFAKFDKFEICDKNWNKESFVWRVSLFDSLFGRISSEIKLKEKEKIAFKLDLRDCRPQNVYLVVRVEKSVHKPIVDHVEPFLWSSKPVFRAESRDLDTNSNFSLFYRMSSLSDEHVTQALNQPKGTTFAAKLGVRLSLASTDDSVTTADCLRPICDPISEFNHFLFVCLQSLRFENQKTFSKARNILIEIQIKENDSKDSKSLPLINGKQTKAFSSVTRHSVNPDFYEEVKIQLPFRHSEKLHVLFSLFHVSCKKECSKTCIGFSWLPINNRSTVGSHSLSVFQTLSPGYLSCESLGLGKGLSMPDMRLVAKDVLRVNCRLVSSLQSSDVQIESSMECITTINSKDTDISRAVSCERALQKSLKQLVQSDAKELLRFSHVILQQLFVLVTRPTGAETVRALLQLCGVLREDVLHDFCQLSFTAEESCHVTLVSSLLRFLSSANEEESRALLRHLWFFLEIHVKCLLTHLSLNPHKRRELRFLQSNSSKSNFKQLLEKCVSQLSLLICQHSRADEASNANKSFSQYLSRLLSLLDRSLVFKLISCHVQNTSSRDIVLSEMRLTCLAVLTAHEHHVPLSHPIGNDLQLSEDFRRKHFLVFLLLQEFKHSLSQSVRHTRQQSLHVLRNLLAKQSFDDRFDDSLVVPSLYLPTIEIVLENVNRITEGKPEERNSTPEVHHKRHNSLPVRFDAFNCDEIKDIVICFAFVLKYLKSSHFQQMSPHSRQQCLLVMRRAVHVFEFSKQQSNSKSKTLNSFNNQSLDDFLARQNSSVQISLLALKVSRLLLSLETLESVLELHVTLMTIPQSLALLIHTFDNVRHVTRLYSDHVFASPLFPQLVSRVVHFCDSNLRASRDSAVDLLFSLFCLNFRRTRFETIVCVSRLASKDDAKDLSHFQTSLTRLEQLAREQEPRLQQTVERVRDILTATQRIRSEARNEYESQELRLFLANSYAQTSLRRTWLENLSECHKQNQDFTEYAMCLSHVIAIVVHELRSKGMKQLDSNHVTRLSLNVQQENELPDADWLEPDDSNLETLNTLIDDCVLALQKSQLFELAVHALKILVDVHEEQRDHKQLAILYTRLAQMHCRAQELNDSGKRLFDTYFRVAFCANGQPVDEFVYREPKVVSLAEMTQKLRKLHPNATVGDDDQSIVVTHVSPQPLEAVNEFERHVGVNRFQFEQRLSSSDASVVQQRKKRVVLITQHFLPFCVKRVPVIEREETILEPIQVATDEMAERVRQLERVTQSEDVKHLQLVLQGSVQVSVNQGPLAYAEAFLSSCEESESSQHLKALFQRFLNLCELGLKMNEKLIKSDQIEYHLALKDSFQTLRTRLDFDESKRTSVQIFDVISGSSLA